MRGRLDHEAAGRRAPLEGLEHPAVPVVDRGLVDTAPPDRVVGHVVQAGEHVRRELVGEHEDALGREVATLLVHRREGRHHLVHDRDLLVHEEGPRFVGQAARRRGRDGVEHLPQQRCPVVGVAVQQLVEQGGARAAEAGQDDRGADLLVGDGGLPAPQIDQPEAVLHDELELAAGPQPPGQVQLGLPVERVAQAPEGLAEPVVPEVGEPGVGPGGGDELVGSERDDAGAAVAEPSAEGRQLVDPGPSGRGLPGHGGPP